MSISPELNQEMSNYYYKKIDQDVNTDDILAALKRMFGQQILSCWLQQYAERDICIGQKRRRTKKRFMKR